MASHPHIFNLAELPWDRINGPTRSRFGAQRKRVGVIVGAIATSTTMTAKTAKKSSEFCSASARSDTVKARVRRRQPGAPIMDNRRAFG
jgi:L-rhamnose isomerase